MQWNEKFSMNDITQLEPLGGSAKHLVRAMQSLLPFQSGELK
jgi:hypothetical protein